MSADLKAEYWLGILDSAAMINDPGWLAIWYTAVDREDRAGRFVVAFAIPHSDCIKEIEDFLQTKYKDYEPTK